jgi:excisionase family DNA binding protein
MSLTTETPTFITAREAGQLLRVAPRTIRRWSEQGRLTSYRLGPRSMRFDAEEITTLIADSAEAPTPSRDVTRREYVPTYPSSNTPRPFRSSQVHVGSGRK